MRIVDWLLCQIKHACVASFSIHWHTNDYGDLVIDRHLPTDGSVSSIASLARYFAMLTRGIRAYEPV